MQGQCCIKKIMHHYYNYKFDRPDLLRLTLFYSLESHYWTSEAKEGKKGSYLAKHDFLFVGCD